MDAAEVPTPALDCSGGLRLGDGLTDPPTPLPRGRVTSFWPRRT